jgi:IS5 family transposase
MEINNSNETNETKSAARGRPRIYNYPSILTCTVTGKDVKTNPLQFEHGWKMSGKSQEEFIATYVSREGRKLQRIAAEKKEGDEKKLSKAVARAAKTAAIAKDAYDKAEAAVKALGGTALETMEKTEVVSVV